MIRPSQDQVHYSTVEEYEQQRNSILVTEQSLAFDWEVKNSATPLELKATQITRQLKNHDTTSVYHDAVDATNKRKVPAGHFLRNSNVINQTDLMKVAQRLPKGAHLHCHFNSCLPPRFLIEHARGVETMWIKSTTSLATEEGRQQAEVQFQVQEDSQAQAPSRARVDLLAADYTLGSWMRYSAFRSSFGGDKLAEDWLESKMLLTESEVYGVQQTSVDIWLRFDICTRMMKGLFGYESAFRAYTEACLRDFIKDNIQYAEVRPNFPSNVLRCDDGRATIDNRGMMRIIVEEVESLQKSEQFLGGLKVIYCCPRSFSTEKIKDSLVECLALKKEFPDLICGYDLVGSEERGHPLNFFTSEFLWFQQTCQEQNIQIPFLFHAGETLDTGSSTDLNLLDAVLLNSKRIGHGFALSRHPQILEMVKSQNICIEVCPISNEVLGLTGTIKGHTVHELLARNVHCTVNSDNGTFYNSTLSHDFYQLMIGSESIDLLGWKQLALWSLEHSEMDELHKAKVTKAWNEKWIAFCDWIVAEHGQRFSVDG